MKPALCLCAHLSQRDTNTVVRVVVPDVELKKSTNTGRLLPLLLSKAELAVQFKKDADSNLDVVPPHTRPVVLFPLEGAPVISRELALRVEAPVCLIVLDGTWSQANRMRKRFLQAKIPFARLPDSVSDDGLPYTLRQGHFAASLSTLQATAAALAMLEDDDSVRAHLLHVFRMMVDRTLWLRGNKHAKDVYGGIPDGVSRHGVNNVATAGG